MICRGCGGLVGRDCFNPSECEWITRQMEADAAVERALRRRDEEDHWREQERAYGEHLEREHVEAQAEAGYLPGLS